MYLVDRLLCTFSERTRLQFYELMVQPIPSEPILSARLAKHYALREIAQGDSEIALMPATAEIKHSRFEQDVVCLGIYRQDRFVGYIWLATGAYEEDEVRCTYLGKPEQESVFDFDLYVFPEYRMGMTFMAIWNVVNAYLSERGKKYSFSRLTRFNLQSRRAHLKLGARCIGHTVFLQLWQFELMVADIAPFVHVSINPTKRVALSLRADA